MADASDIQVGPWGGKGGYNPWTFKQPATGRISEIRISAMGCVDSLRFTYTDQDKVKHHSETYGGDGGKATTITFADDEILTEISGTVGKYANITVITSLTFQTNKKTYGPFGTNQGTTFSLPVTRGKIAGFSGNYGDYVDSFAIILHPY